MSFFLSDCQFAAADAADAYLFKKRKTAAKFLNNWAQCTAVERNR